MKILVTAGRSLHEAAAKKKTYVQAAQDIMNHIASKGWKVVAGLKIPHATSPDGKVRVWFKAQAVYFNKASTPKELNDFGNARSMHIADLRVMDGPAFLKDVEHWEKLIDNR